MICILSGCAVERGKIYVKNGKKYGVTSSKIWRGQWWNYYERGTSYAKGEFWDDAIADFQSAIKQRVRDQRRARTYGLHFIDYFPHRELGIVYYRLQHYLKSIRELESSLDSVDSAKAKFYLNKARRSYLEQIKGDKAPPRILVTDPPDGLLTNNLSIRVAGFAEDDNYVSAVSINRRAQFIELAEPRISFTQQIDLRDGVNSVDIAARDLLGRHTNKHIVVELDRQGPILSLDEVKLIGRPPRQRIRIDGFLADYSRITRFVIGDRNVPLQMGNQWEFHEEIQLKAGITSLPFEVEDAAGNVTRGDIALTPLRHKQARTGKPANQRMVLLAFLNPGNPVSDSAAFSAEVVHAVYIQDRDPPVITLRSVAEQETVYDDTFYIEGLVTDAGAITAFTINRESIWHGKGTQLFFGRKMALKEGENSFLLEAMDEAGNVARQTFVVTREIRPIRQIGSRLLVSILPFAKRGIESVLSQVVYENLFSIFVNQRRFNLVERLQLENILQELKLSQTDLVDPATAAKTGKIMAAEGMLIGTVTETPKALEIFVRFVDVETSVILAAVDVYGEDLDLQRLKTLAEGMAWKLERQLPLVEGIVISRQDKVLLTDLSEIYGVKQYMKLIVFRPGQDILHPDTGRILRGPDTILGEARLTTVSDETAEATLLFTKPSKNVKELDKVITK